MEALQKSAVQAAYNAFIGRSALNRGGEGEAAPGQDNLLYMTAQQVCVLCITASASSAASGFMYAILQNKNQHMTLSSQSHVPCAALTSGKAFIFWFDSTQMLLP